MKQEFDLASLIRPNILGLKPYRSARDDFKEGILLDANENPFELDLTEKGLNRYPDPHHEVLRQKLATLKMVAPNQLFLGNGSDEAIDLIYRIFCRPGIDNVITTPPTYGMYKVSASINDVEVRECLLDETFNLQTEQILQSIDQNTKAIFLCSPNNPTANDLDHASIERILQQFNGLVVIDEAYIDFTRRSSWNQRLTEFPNLLVLQTMSKAYGLAGLRLGMAFGSAEIISWLMRVKAPYNLSKPALRIAEEATTQELKVQESIDSILKERNRLEDFLKQHPKVEKLWPSDANFILFRIKKAETVYKILADRGIIIRYRGNEPLCENCLRLSVGNEEENNAFIAAFNQLFSS